MPQVGWAGVGAAGGGGKQRERRGGDTETRGRKAVSSSKNEPLLPLVPPAEVQRRAGTRHLEGRCARVGRTGGVLVHLWAGQAASQGRHGDT